MSLKPLLQKSKNVVMAGILVSVFISAVFGYQVYDMFRQRPRAYDTCLAMKRPVTASFRQRGTLIATDKHPIIAKLSGTLTYIAETGTPVMAGDMVFSIDVSEHRERLGEVQEKIEDEMQQLEWAEERLHMERFKGERELRLKEARLDHARLKWIQETSKPDPNEIRKLAIDKEIGLLDIKDARMKLDQQQRLYKKGFISRAALEPYTRKLKIAQIRYRETNNRIKLAQKGISQEERMKLQAELERAESDVQRGQIAYQHQLDEIKKEILIHQRRLQQLRNELAQKTNMIENTTGYASRDGLVMRGRSWGETYQPGMEISAHAVAVFIIAPERLAVALMIHESDYQQVRQGMPVRVTLPAFPDRVFDGILAMVGSVGQDRNFIDPAGNQNTESGIVMFNGLVRLNQTDRRFRPGMSAIVEFEIPVSHDLVVVPRKAIHRKNGKFYVYKQSDHQIQFTEITGFAGNDMDFCVKTGLVEKDVVILNYGDNS